MSNPLDEALAAMDARLEPEEASPEEQPSELQPEEAPAEPAETAEEDRARDEQGRFAKAAEEPTREERLQAYLEKYGGDVEKAYEASVHAQQKIGQQNWELGELRKQVEEREEAPVPIDQPTADWFEQQVDSNPYGAAVWALQNDRSGVLYNKALDSWYDIEPRQAAAFERELALNQVKQEFQQQLQTQTQPLAEQEMARAFRDAAERHPDVKDNLGPLLDAAVQNSPVVTQALMQQAQQGNFETRVQVFDAIISLAKGQNTAQVAEAVRGAADQEAAAARQMKQAGGVATQTQAVAAETVSSDEQWLRDNFDQYLAPAE